MTSEEYLEVLDACLNAGHTAPVIAAMLTLVDDASDENLTEAYVAWSRWYQQYPKQTEQEFVKLVQDLTGEECRFCADCSALTWDCDMSTVDRDRKVCDDNCFGHYIQCARCDDYVSEDNVTYAAGADYCESCYDNNFSYCEDCDEHYDNDFAAEHNHIGCECDPPHPEFEFPANGDGVVTQDERLTVNLPKGTIDEAGINRIKSRLYDTLCAYDATPLLSYTDVEKAVTEVGTLWQGKRGNFTKRLSSELFKQHKVKLDPELISEIGNMARQHSSSEATWHVEFTRDLNQSAEAFSNDGSCWWGSHSTSRCALKSWGGMGLRSFEGENAAHAWPTGRVWVQPLRIWAADYPNRLVPTHHTSTDAYVVFNAYGDLSGYAAARIVAHLTGKTYRKIELSTDYQYINSNAGYLVADEATCAATESLYFAYKEHDKQDAHTFNLKAAA
jgi:hypothetical protein